MSGDTKVHPQEVKMHQGSPSVNKHGERMHGEYNNSETYLLFYKSDSHNFEGYECNRSLELMMISIQVTGKYKNTGKKQSMSQLAITFGSGELSSS